MTEKKEKRNEEVKSVNDDKESGKPVCFVIMPIADMVGYEPGHFTRVYEYLIKPAVINAGYTPVRADDTTKTDYIVVGIIQRIIESDMVLCDLSGRNANVLYELGIRHAFNKPVTLIKDDGTEKIFDIQGLRYTEYAASLRIDKTQDEVAKIKKSIEETGASENKDINSIVKMASVHAAETPDKTTISGEANIILSALKQIDNRITNIENNKKIELEKETGIILPSGEPISQGETLYVNGERVGVFLGRLRNKNFLLVETPEKTIKMIDPKLSEYQRITSIPF